MKRTWFGQHPGVLLTACAMLAALGAGHLRHGFAVDANTRAIRAQTEAAHESDERLATRYDALLEGQHSLRVDLEVIKSRLGVGDAETDTSGTHIATRVDVGATP